jgi:hypothetical protein
MVPEEALILKLNTHELDFAESHRFTAVSEN